MAAVAVSLLSLMVVPAIAGPVLHVSRGTIKFGDIPRNLTSPTQPLFVTNTGDAPLTLTGASISGINADEFFAVGGTCGPVPFTLAPGGRCHLDFAMKVTLAGGEQERYATLSLASNATPSQVNVALYGIRDSTPTGLPADPDPDWLDFAPQAVGSTSPTQTIAVTNTGNLDFVVQQFSLAGGDLADFSLASTCAPGMNFRPGDRCTATIAFVPLSEGPRSTELQLHVTFRVSFVEDYFRYSITGVGAPAGTPTAVSVVEYYNAALDHYFITWVAAEQVNLDAGNTPTRWNRTGSSFRTFTSVQTGTSPVCRYYIPPGKGDSHFFGRGTVECNATGANNPTFVLEDPLFMQMFLPVAGVCAAGTTPVYRVFSNRPDANHRYMTDKAIRDQMVAKGWLAEGDGPDLVVMCAP